MVGFLSILRPAVTGDDALRVVRGTQTVKLRPDSQTMSQKSINTNYSSFSLCL